ncbi:MAG: ComEA family DNA-binding protein [Prevotella sp.]|nr:ComEA family DNA-binding protein [Staphylococcus sp.]MCM1350280.1 ComEA family DNA-binding protein [Prevotella sp.]
MKIKSNRYNKVCILLTLLLTLFLPACGSSPTLSSNTSTSFTTDTSNDCLIDLRGEVMHPGIYKVESGSLLYDVIELAGGFTAYANITNLNLVSTITSNMKIVVEKKEKNKDIATPITYTKINLNSCTKAELLTLPGIGDSKANAILSYREKVGAFQQIEDLLKVNGIGQTLFQDIQAFVTI